MIKHRDHFAKGSRLGWIVRVAASILSAMTYASLTTATAQDVNETIAETGAIFTYILDTTTPSSEPLTPEILSAKRGWQIVESDVTDHTFHGDAVLLNDALALVFRHESDGAELYARLGTTFTMRARLLPLDGQATSRRLSKVAIEENTPGTVAINATYRGEAGYPVSVQFRLVTGQIYVETQGLSNAKILGVRLDSEYLIVPDFFADDLVYQAKDLVGERSGLPAENFIIHLTGGGDGLVTCVWETREQRASAISGPSQGATRIDGADIAFHEDAAVWVSVLERPQVWHVLDVPSDAERQLDWSPPFPARWRADFLSESEAAESWNFEESKDPQNVTPIRGTIAYPCWFDSSKAYIRPPATMDPPPEKAVIYPIDRIQGTPLDVFCLVDIMRATLGFGACQYVLDLEGLDAETSPTPALVMDWVEKQFKSGRDTRSRDTMVDRLETMVAHVSHADQRIKTYDAFAKELIASIGDSKESTTGTGVAEEARKMRSIAMEMAESIGGYLAEDDPVAAARKASETVISAIGLPDGPAICEGVNRELHAIGEYQDRVLSKGRMAVRRIAQLARDTEERGADDDFATSILKRAGEALREMN